MFKKQLRISHVNIFVFCLILILLAYFSKRPIREKLENNNNDSSQIVDDSALISFLAVTEPNALKNYKEGVKLAPGCPVGFDGNKWGTEWRAIYNDGSEISKCVPGVYESKNSYIPCSSSEPGPPDISNCSSDLSTDCKAKIASIRDNDFQRYHDYRGIETKKDIQQYLYACKTDGKRLCPCMYKWGSKHKPYKCDAPLEKWKCESTGRDNTEKLCVSVSPEDPDAYDTKEECNSVCNPIYPYGYSCKDKCANPNGGPYKNQENCYKSCGPPFIKGYSCENKKCVYKKDGGDYPSRKKCYPHCGPPYINGYNCKDTGSEYKCKFSPKGGTYPDEPSCLKVCGKGPTPDPPRLNGTMDVTNCYKFRGRYLDTPGNTNFFKHKCTTDIGVPTSTLKQVITTGCPSPGWARGLCNLTSPDKLLKNT